VYDKELSPRLPSKIIDMHVHIGLAEHIGPITEERKKSNWAYEVGLSQSWEELRGNLGMLFPGREVEVLAFGVPLREVDLELNNAYVLSGLRDPANRANGLLVTRPEWPARMIDEAIRAGFAGSRIRTLRFRGIPNPASTSSCRESTSKHSNNTALS